MTSPSNAAKGERDPSNWLPVAADQCRYLGDWIVIKVRWGMTADPSEAGRIRSLLRKNCAGPIIEAPQPLPADAPSAAPLGLYDARVITTPSTVYYRTCADARAAGAAPLLRGSPGYRSALDKNGDGVACSS